MDRFPNRPGRWLSLALVLAILSGPRVLADENVAAPPLLELMAQMFDDLEKLNHGLIHSDDQEVVAAAERIAHHPMVEPAQRAAIAGTLGQDMVEFKGYDTAVHDAALGLSAAARGGDHAVVLRRYNELVGGCVGCHARFRDRVREALESR